MNVTPIEVSTVKKKKWEELMIRENLPASKCLKKKSQLEDPLHKLILNWLIMELL